MPFYAPLMPQLPSKQVDQVNLFYYEQESSRTSWLKAFFLYPL